MTIEPSAGASIPTPNQILPERPLSPALKRGWKGCCPNCGEHTLFANYLTVADECTHCGEALHHHRADDLPAWLTMVIVGHVLAVALLAVENAFAPALWVHGLIFGPFVILSSLWLLPHVKGAVVGMQWAWRMHGFGGEAD
ncbi:MAG: DUF983 domain-containing protein [Pseudomonadota bacterium]